MSRTPNEIGHPWEWRVVRHAQAKPYNLPWDKGPLHGNRDLLDVTGCQPMGLLVGCKAITRTGRLQDKLGPSMVEGQTAKRNWQRLTGDLLVPVQVIQRSGKPIGQAYVVMEYDDFLRWVTKDA